MQRSVRRDFPTLTFVCVCLTLLATGPAFAQAPSGATGAPRTVAVVGRVQIDLGSQAGAGQGWIATVLVPIAAYDRGGWKTIRGVADDPVGIETLQGSVFYGVRNGSPWSCLGGQSRKHWGSLGYKLWGLSSEIFEHENETGGMQGEIVAPGYDASGQLLVVTHPLTRRPEGATRPRWRKSWVATRIQDSIVLDANKGAGTGAPGDTLARRGPLETRRERPFWLKQDLPAIWVEYQQRLKSADGREGFGVYHAVLDLTSEGEPQTVWESRWVVPDVAAAAETELFQFIDYCDLTGDGVSEVVLRRTRRAACTFQLYEYSGKTLVCVAEVDEAM